MYPLKRESPSQLVTPPVNLVLINPKKNTEIDEENRRLIARVAPVCLAYDSSLKRRLQELPPQATNLFIVVVTKHHMPKHI